MLTLTLSSPYSAICGSGFISILKLEKFRKRPIYVRDVLNRERTMAGLQAARARGRKGGRRKKLSADDLMMTRHLLDGNFSAKAVADRLHVHRSTLFRRLKATEDA